MWNGRLPVSLLSSKARRHSNLSKTDSILSHRFQFIHLRCSTATSTLVILQFIPRDPNTPEPLQKNIKSDEIVAMIWMIRAISIALSFYNFRSILTSVLRHRDRGRRRRRDQEEERERCSSFRAVNLPSVRDVGRMKKAKVKRKKEITLEVFPPLSV